MINDFNGNSRERERKRERERAKEREREILIDWLIDWLMIDCLLGLTLYTYTLFNIYYISIESRFFYGPDAFIFQIKPSWNQVDLDTELVT